MTLDLDELERKAKAWLAGDEWLREHTHDWSNGRAHPSIVIALIERVRELGRLLAEESTARIRKLDLSTKDAEGREKDQRNRTDKRVAELERVAKAVRSITKDVAEHGMGADCPYVSQEEARELLAIIDGAST